MDIPFEMIEFRTQENSRLRWFKPTRDNYQYN